MGKSFPGNLKGQKVKKVTPQGDTDFSKLVNLCPVKKFSIILIPVNTFLKKKPWKCHFTLRKQSFIPANSAHKIV